MTEDEFFTRIASGQIEDAPADDLPAGSAQRRKGRSVSRPSPEPAEAVTVERRFVTRRAPRWVGLGVLVLVSGVVVVTLVMSARDEGDPGGVNTLRPVVVRIELPLQTVVRPPRAAQHKSPRHRDAAFRPRGGDEEDATAGSAPIAAVEPVDVPAAPAPPPDTRDSFGFEAP